MARTSLIFQTFVSLLTVPFQLNLGLHTGHFPSIILSATALMFHFFFSRARTIPTFPSWPSYRSFQQLFPPRRSPHSSNVLVTSRLTPISHDTIFISVVAIHFSSATDIGHMIILLLIPSVMDIQFSLFSLFFILKL